MNPKSLLSNGVTIKMTKKFVIFRSYIWTDHLQVNVHFMPLPNMLSANLFSRAARVRASAGDWHDRRKYTRRVEFPHMQAKQHYIHSHSSSNSPASTAGMRRAQKLSKCKIDNFERIRLCAGEGRVCGVGAGRVWQTGPISTLTFAWSWIWMRLLHFGGRRVAS